MLTATMTPVSTSHPKIPVAIEHPPRLPSMLHDLLWYIEIEIQRTGSAPSLKQIRQSFRTSYRTATEMVRLLRDKDLVYLWEGDHLCVRNLTDTGRLYCYAYAPA